MVLWFSYPQGSNGQENRTGKQQKTKMSVLANWMLMLPESRPDEKQKVIARAGLAHESTQPNI